MKIENINEVMHLTKEFMKLKEYDCRLHEGGVLTVQINGKDITIPSDLRKLIRKNLIEVVRERCDEIMEQLETL